MTSTVSVLTDEAPNASAIVTALAAVDPDLQVPVDAKAYLPVYSGDADEPALHIESPSLIQVPGEAERLLGVPSPPAPYWWTDIHSPAGEPVGCRLAVDIARALVAELGGVLVSS